MEKIGLIAGNRKFPLLFAEAARKRKYAIVAVAVKRETSSAINKIASKVYWLGLGEYSRLFEIFKAEGITRVAMAGQINPRRLFGGEIAKDAELTKLLADIRDKRADTIFGAIADRLAQNGLELIDSTTFLEEHIPKKGALTRRTPGFDLWDDVYFGFSIAKTIGCLDIGQTVAVKNKAIVAIEALEGTDQLIVRAGKIAGPGVVIVKVSKPNQDMRFDIPVVGLRTIKTLARARAACLAIESGKTLFIDRAAGVAFADKQGLVVVAV